MTRCAITLEGATAGKEVWDTSPGVVYGWWDLHTQVGGFQAVESVPSHFTVKRRGEGLLWGAIQETGWLLDCNGLVDTSTQKAGVPGINKEKRSSWEGQALASAICPSSNDDVAYGHPWSGHHPCGSDGMKNQLDCFTLLLARHLADVSCYMGPSMPSGICMEIHKKIVRKRKKKQSRDGWNPRQPHVYL